MKGSKFKIGHMTFKISLKHPRGCNEQKIHMQLRIMKEKS